MLDAWDSNLLSVTLRTETNVLNSHEYFWVAGLGTLGFNTSLSETGCCIFRATVFRYFRLNGLQTLWFSRRRPQISVLHVLEDSFHFTLDVLDPWCLVASVGGFYKLHWFG